MFHVSIDFHVPMHTRLVNIPMSYNQLFCLFCQDIENTTNQRINEQGSFVYSSYLTDHTKGSTINHLGAEQVPIFSDGFFSETLYHSVREVR